MAGSIGNASGASSGAGGPAPHIPVMLDEVVEALRPARGETIVDGTFGAGGYSLALLDRGASVIAIDQDPAAIENGVEFEQAHGDRLTLVEGRFSTLDQIARDAGHDAVDGVVLDIGVSSMQLDQAERGFSFQKDGPLDMRMGGSGPSAADIVNGTERGDLTRIIGILGEERQASRIAARIAEARQERPFTRTLELAAVVEKALGRKSGERIHPATRTFQALRIFVNRELEELALALFAAERILKPGGRLAVVTFHSLEDRIVKQFFANRSGARGGSRHLPEAKPVSARFEQPIRSAIKASKDEAESNPRARSAKLRWGIRTDAPPLEADIDLFGLPNLKSAQTDNHA